MLTFSFTVGSADDARVAAEVCDFLAERMAPDAVPSTRTRRSSKVNTVQLPNDKPSEVGVGEATALVVPSVLGSAVSDPAALYAALSGTAPVAESSPAQVDPPVVGTRDDRLTKTRELVKTRGGKWFGDYMKAAKIDKKLTEYTDEELIALHNAAVSGNLPVSV